MKLFISHSSKDEDLVRSLIDLLESALPFDRGDILATSIPGYRLPAGAHVDDQLRSKINDADSCIALISPASVKSMYVIMELGARWGASKHVIPLLAPGSGPIADSPMAALNPLRIESPASLHQLLEDLAEELQIAPDASASAYQQKIDAVLDAAHNYVPDVASPSTENSSDQQSYLIPAKSISSELESAWQDCGGPYAYVGNLGHHLTSNTLKRLSECKTTTNTPPQVRIQILRPECSGGYVDFNDVTQARPHVNGLTNLSLSEDLLANLILVLLAPLNYRLRIARLSVRSHVEPFRVDLTDRVAIVTTEWKSEFAVRYSSDYKESFFPQYKVYVDQSFDNGRDLNLSSFKPQGPGRAEIAEVNREVALLRKSKESNNLTEAERHLESLAKRIPIVMGFLDQPIPDCVNISNVVGSIVDRHNPYE